MSLFSFAYSSDFFAILTTSFSSSTVGSLWNNISQENASKASQNMYYGNSYVESDLVNSYAWDTAIVYVQAMGNSNYANAVDGNGTLNNTGETRDEKCKIWSGYLCSA